MGGHNQPEGCNFSQYRYKYIIMEKKNTLLDGKTSTLFIDQYGDREWATTLKELKGKCPGRVSKMYFDRKDGTARHAGYVIGPRWFTAYREASVLA